MADLAKIVDDLSSLTVLEAAEVSKMLEVDRPHRRVARVAYSAYALDSSVGIDVQDVVLGRMRSGWHRSPHLATAEWFAFEIEKRSLRRQLENRETDVGDLQSGPLRTRSVP